MDALVLARGHEGMKCLGEKQRTEPVVPFLGLLGEGEKAEIGLGLILESGSAIIWPSNRPTELIRSWRAMKMFEHLSVIDRATALCAWCASGREMEEHEKRYAGEMVWRLGGDILFEKIRREVLSLVPLGETLDFIAVHLDERGIPVDVADIEREITLGHLTLSPKFGAYFMGVKMQEQLTENEKN